MTPQTKKWRKKEKMVRKKQTKTFRRRSYVLWYHNPRIKLKKHRYTPLQAHTPKKLTNSSMNLFLLYVAMLALSLPLSFPLSVRLCVCIYLCFIFICCVYLNLFFMWPQEREIFLVKAKRKMHWKLHRKIHLYL